MLKMPQMIDRETAERWFMDQEIPKIANQYELDASPDHFMRKAAYADFMVGLADKGYQLPAGWEEWEIPKELMTDQQIFDSLEFANCRFWKYEDQ